MRFEKWSNLIGWEPFSKYLENQNSFRHAVFAEVSRTKSLMNTENFRKILSPVFEKSAKNHIYRHVRACPGMFGRTRDISKHIYDSFSIRSTIMQNMGVYTLVVQEILRFVKWIPLRKKVNFDHFRTAVTFDRMIEMTWNLVWS